VQSKPKTVMDEIVPIGQLKPPRSMKQPQYFKIGGPVNIDGPDDNATQRLADGPPTTEQPMMVSDNQGLRDRFDQLDKQEKDQLFDFMYEFDRRQFPESDKMRDDFLFDRFEELYESQFPERLQAQFERNMNGGIMAQNTQTGIDGIPEKFDI
tara:strand:- start:31 stop:489 length:459 start_codon:yes stop_codon:yes gene_type:complete